MHRLESCNSVPIVRKDFPDRENTGHMSPKELGEAGACGQRAVFAFRVRTDSGKLSVAVTHSDKSLSVHARQSRSICA